MNPQKITEWLLSQEFLKSAGGMFLGSGGALLIAFQQMEHKIDLSKIETDKKIEALEQKMLNDRQAIYAYVDSNHKLIELQYQYIVESVREMKDGIKEIKSGR